MTTILIVESNSPDLLAIGKSAASSFLRTFQALVPEAELRVACPYAAALREDALDGIDGVVFSGSGVMWSTDGPEAAPLRAEMERVFAAGLPVWGSCNGMQLAASVLGGRVGASPNGFELGTARDVQVTEEGAAHPMMAGRAAGFAVPCIHRDEVQSVPEGAVLMAGNGHSPVQAMVYESGGVDFWGTQYHPEMSLQEIAAAVRGKGLFEAADRMADRLEIADQDADAAAEFGTSPEALAVPVRGRELVNWIAHLHGRR
ncbi:type 1 glutamine amidotransferase [Shimia sp. FJ5]|uniref:type 1 glutamine amidotransferase n=1 Tax=Shimia sp. FJ5 TaxID=3079054 RepID=UPI002636A459|nr:type 1 glutamine amidotransferase [Shimia sp. FJ5]MDV4146309.1 type 1 glutamine amidotransferase [Shimia sp. FJ5]